MTPGNILEIVWYVTPPKLVVPTAALTSVSLGYSGVISVLNRSLLQCYLPALIVAIRRDGVSLGNILFIRYTEEEW